MTFRLIWRALAATLGGTVAVYGVAACGTSSGDQPSSGSSGGTIRWAAAGGYNSSYAPLLVAQGQGLFSKQNVQVELNTFATGSSALAALIGGSADVASISGLDMLRSAQKQNGVVAVYTPFDSAASSIIARKELQATYGTDIAKFKDAKWGYAAEGTSSTYYLKTLAEKSGLNWDRLGRNALGTQSAILASLTAGKVDIVSTDLTTASKAIQQGVGYLVLNTNDPDATTPYWGKQFGSVFATTKSFLQKRPDLIQGFVAGLVDGQHMLQQNIGDASRMLALFTPEVQTEFKATWDQQWKLTAPAFDGVDGTLTDEMLTSELAWATSCGALPPGTTLPPSSEFADNSFVERAFSTLGYAKPTPGATPSA
ncbi:ABC transporter substrate-binding protein [Dactylosporangium sp. NPDC005572]|uniref:ABC transporter substrate-binding protein n=1 Tax=Dactylosporangium sp. NPDC005572 TaxID=3156889 RepID=UPI0033BBE6ED